MAEGSGDRIVERVHIGAQVALRDDGLLEFLSAGQYLLLETPIAVESEDLSEAEIEELKRILEKK